MIISSTTNYAYQNEFKIKLHTLIIFIDIKNMLM